ncbi:hypothetical protein J2T14_004952 [Paenibacillus harenae]|nr:hypothetical protein [Paenibacillus harenae]
MVIDQEEDVESFCVFFRNDLAGEVLRTLDTSTNGLLTDPYREHNPIEFFEKTYLISPGLNTQLESFKTAELPVLKHDLVWLEEKYLTLMQTLLLEQIHSWKEIENLHAIRRSTKEELYKRISIAHDYIRSLYDRPITLNEIARCACLSPNHLLRNYARLYGKTPFQHQQNVPSADRDVSLTVSKKVKKQFKPVCINVD